MATQFVGQPPAEAAIHGHDAEAHKRRRLDEASARAPSATPSKNSMYVSAADRTWWDNKVDAAELANLIYKEAITDDTVVTSVPAAAGTRVQSTTSITLQNKVGVAAPTDLAIFSTTGSALNGQLSVTPVATLRFQVTEASTTASNDFAVSPSGTTRFSATNALVDVNTNLLVRNSGADDFRVTATNTFVYNNLSVRPDGSSDVLTATSSALTSLLLHSFSNGVTVAAGKRATLGGALVKQAVTASGVTLQALIAPSETSTVRIPRANATINAINASVAPVDGQYVTLLLDPAALADFDSVVTITIDNGWALTSPYAAAYDTTNALNRGILTLTGSPVTMVSFGSVSFVYSSTAAGGAGAWLMI